MPCAPIAPYLIDRLATLRKAQETAQTIEDAIIHLATLEAGLDPSAGTVTVDLASNTLVQQGLDTQPALSAPAADAAPVEDVSAPAATSSEEQPSNGPQDVPIAASDSAGQTTV